MEVLSEATSNTSAEVHVGPLTRARAKLLNQQVLLFLNESSIVIDESWVLPHANVLCILRFEHCEAFGTERKEMEAGAKAMEEKLMWFKKEEKSPIIQAQFGASTNPTKFKFGINSEFKSDSVRDSPTGP